MYKNLFAAGFVRLFSFFFIVALLLSTLGTTPVSAATLNVCPTCTYITIQSAINAASAGDTIIIAAGTYHENINIDKHLQIIGAGSSTIITQSLAVAGDASIGVVQFDNNLSGTAVTPILLQNLRIEPIYLAGISIGRWGGSTGITIDYLRLDNVQVIGTNTNPNSEQERGLYVDPTSTLNHFEVNNSSFDNLTLGWYLHKEVSADTSTVNHITVNNTTFNHNNHKGIYAEKLSNATFIDCVADQNGFDSSRLPTWFRPWSAGIDINLKAGNYQNIAFNDCNITNNAIDEAREGVGLTIKARDDGATYGAFPATLTNVDITGGNYVGNERGISIGGHYLFSAPAMDVEIHNANIQNNTQHYSGAGASDYGDIINYLNPFFGGEWIDAENNWWGDAAGPLDNNPATGTTEVPPCTATRDDLNMDGVGAGVIGYVDYCPWQNIPASPPHVIYGVNTIPSNNITLPIGPTQIFIEYDQDIKNDGSAGAANNIANYILVEANGDGFQTVDCASGVAPNDITFPINIATYLNGSGFIATLDINSGTSLPDGSYRLYICGTTSIENHFNIKLNGGASDSTLTFHISNASGGIAGDSLPATGFPHGRVTKLDFGLGTANYTSTDLELVIPKLGVEIPIVGVPQSESGWDVTWLGNSAGYLAGSAFPTWAGNTVITGHVWDSYNQPGIFSELKTLGYGDQVQIKAWGLTYTYEVRESDLVTTKNVSAVLQSEEYDWLTLLTCEFYNPFTGDYLFRRSVRAVLVIVK